MRSNLIGLLVMFFALTNGCEKKDTLTQTQTKAFPTGNKTAPRAASQAALNEPNPVQQAQHLVTPSSTAPRVDWLHQPFADAINQETVPLQLPPLKNRAGLSIGKVYSEVQSQWNSIKLRDDANKPIRYVVSFKTAEGPIEMVLFTEIAPNHCRNFIALVRAGFYKGLAFETRIGEPQEGALPQAVAAGSIASDGDDLAHLGYWLKAEILNDEVAKKQGLLHQPGMVGAIHLPQMPDSACCRFYVCLTAAPQLDGQYTLFAKVTQGLPILEKLFKSPVRETTNPPPLFQTPLLIEDASVQMEQRP